MMKDDDRDTIEMMARLGGGFVKALAAAALQADGENYRKLKAAFPEYWADYEEKVRLMKKRKDKDA